MHMYIYKIRERERKERERERDLIIHIGVYLNVNYTYYIDLHRYMKKYQIHEGKPPRHQSSEGPRGGFTWVAPN